jgi:hypothetical protein
MLFALHCGGFIFMVFVGVTHLWKRTCVWKRTSLLSSQLLLSEKSAKCGGLVNHLAMSLRIYLKFNPLISYHNRRASEEVFTIGDQRMIANRMASKGRSLRG